MSTIKEIRLNRIDLKIAAMSVVSFLKAAAPGLTKIKPNSLEWKVFAANTDIKAKLETADKLYDLNPDREDAVVPLDRNQTKVLIATLVHTSSIQKKVLDEYDRRPDNHKSFANEDGRRKADYVVNLKARSSEVLKVLDKLKGAL